MVGCQTLRGTFSAGKKDAGPLTSNKRTSKRTESFCEIPLMQKNSGTFTKRSHKATQAAIQKDVKTFHTVLETVSIAVASLVFVHGPYAIVCWLLSVPATGCVYQGRISSDNFLHASPLR